MKKTFVAVVMLVPTMMLSGCVTETVYTPGYTNNYVYSGTGLYSSNWNTIGYGGYYNRGWGDGYYNRGWAGRGWNGGGWHGGWHGGGWHGGGWHGGGWHGGGHGGGWHR